tara:strand:- start:520 stop:723 length:204 start_codon:yes stop_codon:yes gene_type:complete
MILSQSHISLSLSLHRALQDVIAPAKKDLFVKPIPVKVKLAESICLHILLSTKKIFLLKIKAFLMGA